jgi:hypothetical protein
MLEIAALGLVMEARSKVTVGALTAAYFPSFFNATRREAT